jgi:two-component system, cell cycle sensor histidine kinase and response regulator CckA
MAADDESPQRPDIRDLFHSLYEHMGEGVALHEVICDDAGAATNYRILDVNPQYERFTGLSPERVVGKLATEAYGVSEPPYLAEFCGVGLSGIPGRLETYFAPHDRFYEISIAPMGKRLFATIFLDVTERHRQEKALRESEWFLQKSQQVAGIGSYRFDVVRGMWRSSYALDELLGITDAYPRDVSGWLELVHPEDRETMGRYLMGEVIGKRQTFERRYRIIRRSDGVVRWVQGVGELELDEAGNPLFMIGTIHDVHEQVVREQALQQKTAELDRFFLLNIDLLCIADQAGRFVRLNQAWEQILGWSLAELEGSEYLQFVHPEDQPRTMEAMATLRNLGEVLDFVNRYRCKDGSYRFIEWRTAPAGNGLVYAAARDVTDRLRYEEALRDSEEKFRRIFELVPLPLTLTKFGGEIVDCNEAFCSHTGLTRDTVIGRSLFDLAHLEGATSLESLHESLQRGATLDGLELRLRRSDGQLRTMRGAARLFGLLGSELVLTAVQDLTDQRNLEQQMLHSQKLESLGVLAGGIAHDFNNLLTGILGNADLAKADMSPLAPALSSLDDIEVAARRAADLCRQLLAYSGRGRFVVQPIDLQELVEEMAHLLSVSISKKAVLKFHFTAGLPAIEADATQLRQIVMNLIVNASEAIGERSGVISVATGLAHCDTKYLSGCFTAAGIREGDFVYLEIADTGHGMDKPTLERIFDPFFSTKFTGRGLGLAAVLGIVRGHKGAIRVYSEPQRGTTFKILLPASEDQPRRLATTPTPRSGLQGRGVVLLADDEETIRNLGRRMLQRAGFEVLLAEDGQEALEKYRANQERVCLVVLDLTMPHMDGEACYRELRRLRPDVKVILSSGYNEQDVVSRFAGKGLAGFVQKPYTSEELLAKIHEAVKDSCKPRR